MFNGSIISFAFCIVPARVLWLSLFRSLLPLARPMQKNWKSLRTSVCLILFGVFEEKKERENKDHFLVLGLLGLYLFRCSSGTK